MRSRLPNGVSTASNATEPTTSNDIFDFGLRINDQQSGICNLEIRMTHPLPQVVLTAFCLPLTVYFPSASIHRGPLDHLALADDTYCRDGCSPTETGIRAPPDEIPP